MKKLKSILTRRLLIAVVATLTIAGLGTYELAKPANAAAAAAPLDDNSVSALLNLDRAMETLAARVTPAVVNITVTSKPTAQAVNGESSEEMQQFFQHFEGTPFVRQFNFPQVPRERVEHGLGSGVIISADGYIVTNNHVVNGAGDIRVTMSNREVFSAKLVGTDPLTDLAVIKINGKNLPRVLAVHRDSRDRERFEPSESGSKRPAEAG